MGAEEEKEDAEPATNDAQERGWTCGWITEERRSKKTGRNDDDDSDEFDEDDHEEEGVHRFEFHNNTFYNNAPLPLPSFGKDLNHAMYPNPTKRKRRQQEINYNKQKMNKTSGMIDAHQFDIGVESDGNNVSVDWTDDLPSGRRSII